MKHALFSSAGLPLGFYDPDFSYPIPADVVEISDEQWREFLDNQGARKWQDGQVVPYAPPITSGDVNAERTRRIVAGKVINSIRVTGRDEDARNLTNLALAAQLRITGGDTTTITTYRDGDNVDHPLTPLQMLSLWQQSAAYVEALYQASWTIKAMEPLPEDVTADELWPTLETSE